MATQEKKYKNCVTFPQECANCSEGQKSFCEVGLKQKFKTRALNLYIDTSNHTVVYSEKRVDLFENDYLPIDDNAFQAIFKAVEKANIAWLEQRRKEIQQTIDYRSETLASVKLNRIAEIDDLIKELK